MSDWRMVAIDTETTGLGVKDRVIQIGAVEVVGRKLGKTFEVTIDPLMPIKADSTKIHGMSDKDVSGKPTFEKVFDSFLEFVGKADLIGHNLGFDIRMINREVERLGLASKYTTDVKFDLEKYVRQDPTKKSDHANTQKMMSRVFPGEKKSLDHLCDRLAIDRKHRTAHGALLDAQLAALCYLGLTRGSRDIFEKTEWKAPEIRRLNRTDPSRDDYVGPLLVIRATPEEIDAHVDTCAWLASNPTSQRKSV